jgi:hypothetical protein
MMELDHRAYPSPVRDAFGPRDTTERLNTHKTDLRAITYRWHPWHGQGVLVRARHARAGGIVLRCVRDELKGFPILEIPE